MNLSQSVYATNNLNVKKWSAPGMHHVVSMET